MSDLKTTNVYASTSTQPSRLIRYVEATIQGYTYTLTHTTRPQDGEVISITLTQRVLARHSWQERRVPHGRRRGTLLNTLMPLLPK